MKKQLIALALIIGLTMATGASADWGRGNRGYGGYGDCPQMRGQMQGQMFSSWTRQRRIKLSSFLKIPSRCTKKWL